MFDGWLVILILVDITLNSASSVESNEFTLPDYDYHWSTKPDLGKRLSIKFASKKKSEKMLRDLKDRIANDTEYFDEVPHFEINSTKKIKSEAAKFEKDFKRVIGMIGVKYDYKRDMYWRTWREISYPNKTKEVVCYRSHSIMNGTQPNCTYCYVGGYWIIEDKPPSCSFEILSFKDDKKLCVANYWQLNKENLSSCPSTIPFQELSYCQIPLLTQLSVYPDYATNESERSSAAVICEGREECEFSTLYKISSDVISFRIINSTNNIIYSRLMKSNGKIYACTEDCGKIDLNTMETTRIENHVVLNMLNSPKRKREYTRKIPSPKRMPEYTRKKPIRKHRKDKSKTNVIRRNLLVNRRKYIMEQPFQPLYYPATKLSFCKQMAFRQSSGD